MGFELDVVWLHASATTLRQAHESSFTLYEIPQCALFSRRLPSDILWQQQMDLAGRNLTGFLANNVHLARWCFVFDMNIPSSNVSFDQASVAAQLAYAIVSWNECVSLIGSEDADIELVLDQAEHELSCQSVRCVRVCGFPSKELTLRGLMAQVSGRTDSDALTDGDLEAGFEALTEPGCGYDRVALLVIKAHGLLPSAVRYIQFACRFSPKLLVVLAGQSNLATTLADDEFAYLRRRITRKLELPNPVCDDSLRPFSTAFEPSSLEPSPVIAARRSGGSGMLVRLGVAALLALVIWTTRWGRVPAPNMQSDAFASRRDLAGVGAEPQAPVTGVLATPSEADPDARQAGQHPVEAEPPTVANMQRFIEPAAPGQERTQATQNPIEAFPLVAAQDPAPPVVAGDVVALQPTVTAAEPPDDGATILAEPPAAAVQEQLAEAAQPTKRAPEQAVAAVAGLPPEEIASPPEPDAVLPTASGAERVTAHAPEPAATQAMEAVLPPNPSAGVNLPIPSTPPLSPMRAAMIPTPPWASEKPQRARQRAEWGVAPVGASPTWSVDGRHCRDIVFRAQLGEEPSDADKQFLRGRCRAK